MRNKTVRFIAAETRPRQGRTETLRILKSEVAKERRRYSPVLVALKANIGGGGGIPLWQATSLAVKLTTPPLSLYMKHNLRLFLYGWGLLFSPDQLVPGASWVAITNWVPSASNHLPWQEYAAKEKAKASLSLAL